MALRQVLPIDAYGEGGFRIAETRYDGHVIVRPGHVERWEIASANPKDLTVWDFETASGRQSGSEHRGAGCGPGDASSVTGYTQGFSPGRYWS